MAYKQTCAIKSTFYILTLNIFRTVDLDFEK